MSNRGHIYNKLVGTGVHSPDGPGMEYIKALKASVAEELIEVKPEDRIVGSFGICTGDGENIIYGWRVDGYRANKDVEDMECPLGDYSKLLLNSMFGGWK